MACNCTGACRNGGGCGAGWTLDTRVYNIPLWGDDEDDEKTKEIKRLNDLVAALERLIVWQDIKTASL